MMGCFYFFVLVLVVATIYVTVTYIYPYLDWIIAILSIAGIASGVAFTIFNFINLLIDTDKNVTRKKPVHEK